MVGDKPLESGQPYTLSMQLPEPVGEKNRLEFSATAKWSKPEANPNLYDTGLEIIDPSEALMDILGRLIEGYMFNSATSSS